jgi:hypothetical protein
VQLWSDDQQFASLLQLCTTHWLNKAAHFVGTVGKYITVRYNLWGMTWPAHESSQLTQLCHYSVGCRASRPVRYMSLSSLLSTHQSIPVDSFLLCPSVSLISLCLYLDSFCSKGCPTLYCSPPLPVNVLISQTMCPINQFWRYVYLIPLICSS